MSVLKTFLKSNLVIGVLAFFLGVIALKVFWPDEIKYVTDTVSVVDTLFTEGPTVYKTRFVYREVEPDTLYITEYEYAPATVSVVSATITGEELHLEYLVNDSLHTITVGIDLPPYGDTYVSVDPDEGLVAQTQRVGFYPELMGGISFTGVSGGVSLWYWNDFLFFRAIHFPTLAGDYTVFDSEHRLIPKAGISFDLDRRTPLRGALYATWDGDLGFSAGLEFPLWSFKD